MFNSLFQTVNPTTFKLYPLFLGIYVAALILSIGLIIYRKKTKKNLKELKKTLRHLTDSLFFFGATGLILLFSRYANVYVLSMEFLHILNAMILVAVATPRLIKFKKANS